MEISKATVGAFALACVAAGAGGGYLATHSNSMLPSTRVEQSDAESGAQSSPVTAVEQSEGVVADSSPIAPVPLVPPQTTVRSRPERLELDKSGSDNRRQPQRPVTRVPAPAYTPTPSRTLAQDERLPIPAPVELPRVATPEPERAVEPAGPIYQELVLAAESVIGLQVDTPVSSDTARVEDDVVARVTRDVKVGDRVAIPAGTKARGSVTLVERGGKLRDRARLGIRFTSVVLADGTRVPIETETIYREGDAPGQSSAAKIGGGAIGGAIIGGILGGAKGAAIGGSIGGGAGTAAVMAGGRSAATLASGSPVTVRLQEAATVTVEK